MWACTTLLCWGAALCVALVKPRMWQTTQALVVRQEAAASRTGQPGKFSDLYEMRTLQETILEIARRRQVVAATIENVAARETGAPALPMDEKRVEKFRKRLSMLPPGGAEFGKTEVFYFAVQESSQDRAVALVDELCTQLELRMRQLIGERAVSLAAEVEKQWRNKWKRPNCCWQNRPSACARSKCKLARTWANCACFTRRSAGRAKCAKRSSRLRTRRAATKLRPATRDVCWKCSAPLRKILANSTRRLTVCLFRNPLCNNSRRAWSTPSSTRPACAALGPTTIRASLLQSRPNNVSAAICIASLALRSRPPKPKWSWPSSATMTPGCALSTSKRG